MDDLKIKFFFVVIFSKSTYRNISCLLYFYLTNAKTTSSNKELENNDHLRP